MRLILVLTLLPVCIGAAAADPLILAETPLGSDRCPVIATAKTDDAGEPLKESEWYASDWRCSGYEGRFVYLAYGDEREGLAFGSEQSATTDHMWHHRFGAWGPSIEWRGAQAGNTGQVPLAAIARYSWNIQMGTENEPPDIGADLAVISLGRGRDDTCIIAWVDTIANPDAVELARKRADEALSGNSCKAGRQPERLGKFSRRPVE
jgi:hypothetical protein